MPHRITLPTHPRRSGVVWALVAGVLGAGLWTLADRHEGESPKVVALTSAASGATGLIQATPTSSLDGTTPDGALQHSHGTWVPGPDLIRRFDYWLTTYGEKSVAAIKADILNDLRDELRPADLARAGHLLNAYLAYKAELARLTPLPAGTRQADALAQQLQAMRDVRARHFSPTEVAGLFGPDDTQDDDTLARLRVMQDRTLSETDKAQRLRALTAQLPPELQAHRTEPVIHLSVSEAVAEARARGASAEEVQAIRTQMVGADAAQRLARLDAEEADWQARVDRYLSLRQTDEAAAEAYKEAHFQANEKLRLSAYSARRPS